MSSNNTLAVIFGCAGIKLNDEEKIFFKRNKPFGLILFERNCVAPAQVKTLIYQFRNIVDDENAPVFIDQEGGRVTRLKPPHWRHPPAVSRFVELAKTRGDDHAIKAIKLNFSLIAQELKELGINVNCAPVLDIAVVGADPIISDRALGNDPALIKKLAAAICDGLLSRRVFPVIKHVPGHGRAPVDSHSALPIVDTKIEILMETDFEAFRSFSHLPLAMTAHVIYSDIDETNPATVSHKVIKEIVRGHMGYNGLLMSDDLSMQALSGNMKERAERALDAGCDIVLHCNAKIDEMTAVVAGAKYITEIARNRWLKAYELLNPVKGFDVEETTSQFNKLLDS